MQPETVKYSLSITVNISNKTDINKQDLRYGCIGLLVFPIATLFGNSLVVLSVILERSLRNATNWFIVSLATADIILAVLVMPLATWMEMSNGYWTLGIVFCDLFVMLDVLFCTASILNLVAISIDRYLAVTRPISYAKHDNVRRIQFSITAVWIVSFLIALPVVCGLNEMYQQRDMVCASNNPVYVISSSVGSFYVPALMLIAIYQRIFARIRERHKMIGKIQMTISDSPSHCIENAVEKNAPRNIQAKVGTCFYFENKDKQLKKAADATYPCGSDANFNSANRLESTLDSYVVQSFDHMAVESMQTEKLLTCTTPRMKPHDVSMNRLARKLSVVSVATPVKNSYERQYLSHRSKHMNNSQPRQNNSEPNCVCILREQRKHNLLAKSEMISRSCVEIEHYNSKKNIRSQCTPSSVISVCQNYGHQEEGDMYGATDDSLYGIQKAKEGFTHINEIASFVVNPYVIKNERDRHADGPTPTTQAQHISTENPAFYSCFKCCLAVSENNSSSLGLSNFSSSSFDSTDYGTQLCSVPDCIECAVCTCSANNHSNDKQLSDCFVAFAPTSFSVKEIQRLQSNINQCSSPTSKRAKCRMLVTSTRQVKPKASRGLTRYLGKCTQVKLQQNERSNVAHASNSSDKYQICVHCKAEDAHINVGIFSFPNSQSICMKQHSRNAVSFSFQALVQIIERLRRILRIITYVDTTKKTTKFGACTAEDSNPNRRVYFTGRRHRSVPQRERKATKTLAIVLGAFLACWLPFFTVNVAIGICMLLEVENNPFCAVALRLMPICTWLGYVNSVVNPIIYTVFNLEFRAAFKKLLHLK